MKVLLIDVNCKHSSTGKIVYDLYIELNKQGYEAAICYGRGPLVTGKNIFKFGIDIETYFHAFMTRITGLTGVYSPFSTRRLISFIDRFQPDVVHINELHAYFVNIAPVINYLKQKNIKTIWTFHCEFMYTGKCGHAYECPNWKTECNNCPQLHEYPKSIWLDFTKYMFKRKKELFYDFKKLTIVTPSNWLADRVKSSFLKDKEIKVIHNGIDTQNIFHPRGYNHLKSKHNLSDQKIILAVAPNLMSYSKGGKWVLELARLMHSENIKFILIGVDDLSKDYGENIIALGRIKDQIELAEYYSMADAFVICSKIENFPTTCLESLSCGTPIFGFDTGGIKEAVPENYGAFVEYGNVSLLREIIKTHLKGKLNIKSKNECKMYGNHNYSILKMINSYINIYLMK